MKINSVNTVSLGEVLEYEQPTKYIVDNTNYDDEFEIPVLTAGKSFLLGYTNETHNVFSNVPVIIFDDFTTAFKYVDFPFKVKSSAMKILKANKEIADIRFLYYRMMKTGIDTELHKRYWISKYSKVKIPLPPLDQQKKIAAILDAADAYRQKTKALLKKYDELTQSLFLDMFGDRSKFNRIKLSQCVTEKNDFVDGPFGSNLKVSHQTPSGVRLIQINNIGVGEFRDKKKKFTSEKKYFELIRHSVQPGDIIIAKMGEPLGRACLVPDYIEKGLVVADCMRMRMTSSKFLKHFVMFFLNSNDAKAQIGNLSKGSTRIRINLSMIRTLEIPAPSIELQNQFAERVQAIERQKAQAQASLVQAEDLFNSLLQRAFKGELI